ncbi:MAG: hypothetical protein ACYSWU_16100 [Planctomycetota bacterium]
MNFVPRNIKRWFQSRRVAKERRIAKEAARINRAKERKEKLREKTEMPPPEDPFTSAPQESLTDMTFGSGAVGEVEDISGPEWSGRTEMPEDEWTPGEGEVQEQAPPVSGEGGGGGFSPGPPPAAEPPKSVPLDTPTGMDAFPDPTGSLGLDDLPEEVTPGGIPIQEIPPGMDIPGFDSSAQEPPGDPFGFSDRDLAEAEPPGLGGAGQETQEDTKEQLTQILEGIERIEEKLDEVMGKLDDVGGVGP